MDGALAAFRWPVASRWAWDEPDDLCQPGSPSVGPLPELWQPAVRCLSQHPEEQRRQSGGWSKTCLPQKGAAE